MNISYNWLKRYVDTGLSAEETAAVLTDIGLEVEGFEKIETVKGGLRGVVVAEVLTCTDHPDSDHLHITTVDVGAAEPLQIVCGAANCRAGLKVLCATVGAVLYPDGGDEEFKIKRSKIRGVESLGMLCAEDELGIGASHDGIMELPADAPVGMPAGEYLRIEDDYLIEIGLTPNRVDAASHIGVARDLAAYLTSRGRKTEVRMPDVSAFAPDNHDLNIKIRVENTEATPRYAGVTVTGCKIGPSPEWMQNCLRAAGINPKNNLVDITNFVLFELGQPLHAFDARKIEGGEVVVRTCAEGTPFVTLDGVERKLTADDLMICSAERPMCIAGVFGGLDSGIGDETADVFIESAYFNPVWVRKTAKRFGLNTDSSFRFERGADPNMQVYAAKRAALLMKELAGGKISSDITDICPAPIADFVFDLSFARVNALIGKEIPEETVRAILAALEVKILGEKEGVLTVAVPPYRVDVQREADLIEDILRIYGYNNVEIPTRVRSTLSYAPRPDRSKLMNMAADFLTANGFTEIMSNSLTRGAYYEGLTSCPAERCVRILNPLSADLNVMRQTLLFNMLEAVALNANRKNSDLQLYEFGNCYFYDAEKRTDENPLAAYSEEYRLAVAVTGLAVPQSWNAKPEKASFFTLRAVAEKLLRRFGVDIYALKTEFAERPLRRGTFDVARQQGAAANRYGERPHPPDARRQAGGLFHGSELRCARSFDQETQDCRRGTLEVPRSETRPGPAGRQAGDVLGPARRRFRYGAQVAEERRAVRRLRGRQAACGQEILRFELHPRRQEPHARREDYRTRHGQPRGAVREPLRRYGAQLGGRYVQKEPRRLPASLRGFRFTEPA